MELIVETSVFNDERLSDDVREVQQVASTAIDIADNNSQYFWCTEVGTDTGVHITLTPQDTFKANPSGYNLLARNNGVEVRDGLTACSVFTNGGAYFNAMLNGTNQLVAKYEASGAQIGAELSGYRNITIDNTNGIRFRNGTVNLAHYNIGSVVFYDGDTTTNHELMNLGITGMTLKNNSGYKTFYVGNNGLIIYDGVNDSHDLLNLNTSGLTLKGIFDNTLSNCAIYGADGLVVYGYTNGTTRGEIAKIYSGLGNVQTSDTTKYAPYYTFGTRSSNTATTIGNYSFVEGYWNKASGYCSHAEGYFNIASQVGAHAEGVSTTASGEYSHAEGYGTESYGAYSHVGGYYTKANTVLSNVIGMYNIIDTNNFQKMIGYYCCNSSDYTKSTISIHIPKVSSNISVYYNGVDITYSQSVSIASESITIIAMGGGAVSAFEDGDEIEIYSSMFSHYPFIIGNGTSDSSRSNAFSVSWDGDVTASGFLTTKTPFATVSDTSTTTDGTFAETSVTLAASGSIGAGAGSGDIAVTANLTNYYPLAISGWNGGNRHCMLSDCDISSRSVGSATVHGYITNTSDTNSISKSDAKVVVHILWVKAN